VSKSAQRLWFREELRLRLSEDLNALIGRELKIWRELAAKNRELAGLKEELSIKPSERKSNRAKHLQDEVAKLNAVGTLYDAERFKNVEVSPYLQVFIKENPRSHTRVRLNRLLLEAAYPKEIVKTKGGVYPDREIQIATPEDSQRCFQEYLIDTEKRLKHDEQFPNEPKQVKPGEDVRLLGGRVQVSGQVAVMSINGLLTKVMFDKNPNNEFFVEESFRLTGCFRT
jgi:hypothetical protein